MFTLIYSIIWNIFCIDDYNRQFFYISSCKIAMYSIKHSISFKEERKVMIPIKLDSLNRCVIPISLRRQLQLQSRDKLMITPFRNMLIIYKYTGAIQEYNGETLSGIIREIDSLGRFVIPMEYVKLLHFQYGNTLEILQTPNENRLLIRSTTMCCALCGRTKSLIPVSGGALCPACVKEVEAILLNNKNMVNAG